MATFIQLFIRKIENTIYNLFKGEDEIHEEVHHKRNIRIERGTIEEVSPNQFIWVGPKNNKKEL